MIEAKAIETWYGYATCRIGGGMRDDMAVGYLSLLVDLSTFGFDLDVVEAGAFDAMADALAALQIGLEELQRFNAMDINASNILGYTDEDRAEGAVREVEAQGNVDHFLACLDGRDACRSEVEAAIAG